MKMDEMYNTTFIEELADQLLKEHHDKLSGVKVIFPNRRAGLFFRQALSQHIDKPLWMPEVLSMQDFVFSLSTLEPIETLAAIFELFQTYCAHQKEEETFEQFYFWGEMILRDFEEIDHYMVNPEHLFRSIKSQKELDEEFYFLDDEDKLVIQSFWSSFLPKTTKSQEAFLETWRILLPIYQDFKTQLNAKNHGYGGMIYRKVTEDLSKIDLTGLDNIYFAGFNALTSCEEAIIKHFVFEAKAQVKWDIDDYYFSSPVQEAGYFMRQYAKDPILGKTFPEVAPKRFDKDKIVTTTGVSLEVGQTKVMAEMLAERSQQPGFEARRSVIVLPKEHMLFPTLHAIPEAIEKINITMGYPLKDTPVYALLESLLHLQNSRKVSQTKGVLYYYKPLLEVLEHPLLQGIDEELVAGLVRTIRRQNRITMAVSELPLVHPIFVNVLDANDNPFDYLLAILEALHEEWKEKDQALEEVCIAQFYTQLSQLKEMMTAHQEGIEYGFFIKLFRRLARNLKIPFTGEPLDGLQIMGILETRNLDFDQVYILSMNEDSWPAAARTGSFIPYNIRKGFDMPVYDHQDSIYAYLFYRLLQRAKEVHIFYNTVSEFNVNGELSRYVQQLQVESGFKIVNRILSNDVKTKPALPILITKSTEVLAKMDRYTAGFVGNAISRPSALTPSALSIYLDCRLKFYYKYVAGLYEQDDVQEELDPMVFGNVLHKSIELLYDAFLAQNKREAVYKEDFFWIRAGVPGAVNKAFKEHYHVKADQKFELEGRSLIASDILIKMMHKILDHDEAYAPFSILALEAGAKDGYALEVPVSVGGKTKEIKVKGIIDRIDRKEGKVRIIDYKTGSDERTFKTVASLIDREDKNRNKAVFQVFMYSYLFQSQSKDEYDSIEPSIFNRKDLFKEDFTWTVKMGHHPISDFHAYAGEFSGLLTDLLTELYDPAIPFDQTEELDKCKYCPYASICSR